MTFSVRRGLNLPLPTLDAHLLSMIGQYLGCVKAVCKLEIECSRECLLGSVT